MPKTEKRSKVETAKENSRGLRGTIGEELQQATEIFTKDNVQILKFHGIYQQDDRDLRKSLRDEGRDKAYQFMIRLKNPGGGHLTPGQWEALTQAADEFGDGTIRLTTRQAVQFYGLGKSRLRDLIQFLDRHLLTSFGACGDGVRNVMCCPISSIRAGSTFDGRHWAERIADHLGYSTSAYLDIWLDGEKLQLDSEPLFGKGYLPRKFKIAIGDPVDNCVDLLTNDIGILPELQDGRLERFHLFVGGGMGSTHGKIETYPRLAQQLTSLPPDQLLTVLTAVVETQRDLGNRSNRKRARMKYLVEELGVDGFRREVEQRLGHSLPEAEPARLANLDLHLGWHRQRDENLHYYGLSIENGRIADLEGYRLKTALREIARLFQPEIMLTPSQDLILSNIPSQLVQSVQDQLRHFGISGENLPSPLRSTSMACPALPTCGLAITEAERRLPGLIRQLENAGFGDESVILRISGCPNSCSRPPVAELGLVGKSLDGYHLYVGGNREGTRLAELFLEDVGSEQLFEVISTLLGIHRRERLEQESFGDTCSRLGLERLKQLFDLEVSQHEDLSGLTESGGTYLPGNRQRSFD
ncbi:MAG: NADPH-dependent assimilatory sulfite reductase hemoprotein subunit [Acidobacteriota bacterium]|nr:MAG: NADPH-dependent assimilatory sulfite reductase hemoprotein subunit [Acidobacteriota bacterium]